MTWNYGAKRHRWEATTHGWRAIAQRAPNRVDWEAAIEPLGGGARIASSVVFRSSDAAREWCEDEITRHRLGLV
jgi:hypothetical protein